jgi:hypothetical protein
MTERRKRRPGPLPVVLTAIATFLVIFVLLAAQLRAGHDPALGPAVAVTSGQHSVVTRTSGAAIPSGGSHSQARVVTHASGAGGEGDD